MSVRLRLTALYGALFLVSSVALLGIVYVVVAHFPAAAHTVVTTGTGGTAGPQLPPLAAPDGRRHAADLHRLLVVSAIAAAGMTVVSIGLGWVVAGRVLRPLRTITAAARRISVSNLHERLALAGPPDELRQLGDTFDGLLGRLERAFGSQRQFVANASHELRTPLTLQRALLEAALTDPEPDPASWRRACERALAAGEQQERLIEALLTLARGERGLAVREAFDLAEIAARVLGQRTAEAARRGPRLTADLADAPTAGDPRLAERLVANLVDNAVRHNTPDGWVEIRTGTRAGRPLLSVANTGPVVAPGDVPRLLEPFQRAEPLRGSAAEGLGLGLCIVQAVAVAHDATLAVAPGPDGGLAVEVTFPA
jgi:signal transduction histidine kinase